MDNGYRVIVLESLKKIFRDKSYSNIIINNNINNIDNKYKGIFRKSVFGVIENLIFIDWVINQISKTKTKKMEFDVLAVLRLAVYQLFFLDTSRENIVVNESVQYLKDRKNIRASKFVNAVLRNIIRNKEKIINDMNKLPYIELLSVKYSYPKWIVEMWQNQFGNDKLEEVLIANNVEAPLEVRVNTLKTTREELIDKFNKKGIISNKCKIAEKGLIIKNPFEINTTEEYKWGLFSIQSESSMLVGQILNPNENSLIIDLCAAPGGKSLNTAEIMNNTGKILSRDIYEGKLPLINKEVKRLGIKNIFTQVYDATKLDENLISKADYCIVDVPCTGLGIIRRKPEIKYKLESDLEDISKIQYRILENASKYLKHKGFLIYSTCTTNKKENIELVNEFLNKNKNFALVDISNEVGNYFTTAKLGYVEIYPHMHNMDGFFIAKMTRV